MPIGNLWAQVPGTAGHQHLTEVACVDVPPAEKRPEFGCFNIGTVTGLLSVKHPSTGICARFQAGRLRRRPRVRLESWWRKTGACGSQIQSRDRAPRGGESSLSSGLCSCPQRRATRRFSLTLSCGPETIPECIHTRAPKAGTCWREGSVWRLRLALTGLGRRNHDGAIEYFDGT